ncbi:MAG: hypothetical protein ACD_77C00368G0004 [uncultured bacterium]|nr:MAG: hypothetical protein ACD_77C00368G0004 [uncultured bacterium]HBY01397.1 single-stranded DNA-binding protein [Rikenellaceae bacterium]
MSLNKVLLIGNVGKDPEVRHLENGSMVARFSIATTERYKDKNGEFQEQTEWHNIVCWRALAERIEKFVKKGSQLFIEGKIRTGSWEDKTGQIRYTVEIVADNIQILGRKQESQGVPSGRNNIQDLITSTENSPENSADDGDLPF